MVEVTGDKIKKTTNMETHYKSIYEILAVHLLKEDLTVTSEEMKELVGKVYRINMDVVFSDTTGENYTVRLFLEFPEEENAENQSVEETPKEEDSKEAN